MTTLNQARKDLNDKFIADWGVTTVFTLTNEEFDEPEKDPWVRFTIKGMPNKSQTLGRKGNRKFEREGILFAQIFIASETGTSQGDEFSTTIRDMFEGERVGGTWFSSMDISEPGFDGKWYVYLVQAIFNFDDTK